MISHKKDDEHTILPSIKCAAKKQEKPGEFDMRAAIFFLYNIQLTILSHLISPYYNMQKTRIKQVANRHNSQHER
jgi:tRNA U34 2-thiouridine synthase MnmA/TrmU